MVDPGRRLLVKGEVPRGQGRTGATPKIARDGKNWRRKKHSWMLRQYDTGEQTWTFIPFRMCDETPLTLSERATLT